MDDKKVCSRCGLEKPTQDFGYDRRAKSGKRSDCKECERSKCRAYRASDPARSRMMSKKRLEANREHYYARKKVHYQENRERLLKEQKERYGLNRESRQIASKKYRSKNREIIVLKSREHYHRRREIERDLALRRIYGIVPGTYAEMFREQGGVCRVCGKAQDRMRLCIDHDHETGAVRSLLCRNCNNALGHVHDDPALLRALAEYLESFRQPKLVETK